MSHTEESARNGHVQIHVSDDLMSASIDLFPPAEGGSGFTVPSVCSELELAGVTWGVDKEGLEKAILHCLEKEKVIRGFVAARGRKPKKSVPSYWHLKKRLIESHQTDLESMNVDYRERSPYILVKKGEPLAKLVPESDGQPGRNIAGDIIPAGNKDIVVFKPGEQTIEKEGVLYAASHGRFDIKDRVMSVNETLDIPGNVDYSTGHIAFPGDVIIHGSVSDGFQVASGKSIFVKQTMDASKVLSRGDLVVEGGIKGRQDAIVRVDGRVAAKFIENATVEAHGDIVVEKAVMHSDINTLNHIDLGEAGVIVGGNLWAGNGLRASRIGRPESPSAHIRIGSDFTVDRKLRSSHEQMDRLDAKLEKLKARPHLGEEQLKLVSQVEEVMAKLAKTREAMSGKLHSNRRAKVTVFGEVLEGTEIHICELSIRLSSKMEGVVFYYDEDGPRIATRNIVDSDKAPLSEAAESEAADTAADKEPSAEDSESAGSAAPETGSVDSDAGESKSTGSGDGDGGPLAGDGAAD